MPKGANTGQDRGSLLSRLPEGIRSAGLNCSRLSERITYCSLGTHVEELGGVVSAICNCKGGLWPSETVLSCWRGGERDLLEVRYVVGRRVGALEGPVVQRSNELLSSP